MKKKMKAFKKREGWGLQRGWWAKRAGGGGVSCKNKMVSIIDINLFYYIWNHDQYRTTHASYHRLSKLSKTTLHIKIGTCYKI
jgi:hypothetical protein